FPGFELVAPDEPDDLADLPALEPDVLPDMGDETGPQGQVEIAPEDGEDDGGWEDPEQEIPRLRAAGQIPPAVPPVGPTAADGEEDGGGWEDPEQEIPRLRAEGKIPAARPPLVAPDADPPAAEPAADEPGAADAPADEPPPVVPVLLGVELAAELSAGAGDAVQLMTPVGRMTPAGLGPGVLHARGAGVYATGVSGDDGESAYVARAAAQAFLRAAGAVPSIVVRLDDPDALDEARAGVVAVAGSPLVVEDWRQIHRGLFSAMFL